MGAKSMIYIRLEDSQKGLGLETIQTQLVSAQITQHGFSNVGIVIKHGEVPHTDILSILKSEAPEPFDNILLYNKDAISPNLTHVFEFLAECKREGIEVYTITEGNLSETCDKYTTAVKETISKDISQNTTDRMRQMAFAGKWTGGRLPYGYSKNLEGYLEINDTEAFIIRKIYEMYAEGLKLATIARVLQDRYNISYKDSRWRTPKLLDIILNPIYKGYPAWGKTNQSKFSESRKRCKMSEWAIAEKKIDKIVIISEELWSKTLEKVKADGYRKHLFEDTDKDVINE